MYHFKEGSTMTYRRFDFSAIVLATLLVIQVGIASYGLGFMKDVAGNTHAGLLAVVEASR
jgi:hypothetical protein